VRTIGLDVHKHFAEAAILEPGRPLRRRRVATTPAELREFADSLGPHDQVALESTFNTWALVDLLRARAGRVVVSNPMKTKAIASAKVKTDKVDAEVLARLLASDFLAEVWVPDQHLRALRRQVSQRASLVQQQTRHRNRIHAILNRNLLDCPYTDLFGKAGQRWLSEQVLPAEERSQLESALRLLAAVRSEIGALERPLASVAFDDEGARHLLSIPGVGLVTALAMVAVIGDIRRFPRPNHLVGYLGLDPKVRQSGDKPARTGHISRQGQTHARAMLIEAAHSAVRAHGPLRAFYERIKSRRGARIALVAVARKLAILAWHLLTDDSDYRWAPAGLTAKKYRDIALHAGQADLQPLPPRDREQERRVLVQAEDAYRTMVLARHRQQLDAAASNGERSMGSRPDARRSSHPQTPIFSTRVDRAHLKPTPAVRRRA
jgi:transposase